MGKIVSRAKPNIEDYRAGRTPGPLYDQETQLYPVEALPRHPIASEEEQRLVNYNWVMAKTIGLLRANRLDVDQCRDIMLKAATLLQFSYAKVYGRRIVLPPINASGR